LRAVRLQSLVAKYCKVKKIWPCEFSNFCILLYYIRTEKRYPAKPRTQGLDPRWIRGCTPRCAKMQYILFPCAANRKVYKNCNFAVWNSFLLYNVNISQPNFVILLNLTCSFKLRRWIFPISKFLNFSYKVKGPQANTAVSCMGSARGKYIFFFSKGLVSWSAIYCFQTILDRNTNL
jgi:hypothetical protein